VEAQASDARRHARIIIAYPQHQHLYNFLSFHSLSLMDLPTFKRAEDLHKCFASLLIFLRIKVVKPLSRLWMPFTFHLSQPEGDVSTVILAIVSCIAMGRLMMRFWFFLDFSSKVPIQV
jgi:hypothetical protein